jgi:hypothetical protein
MKTTEKTRTIDDKDKRIIALTRRGFTLKEMTREVDLTIDGIQYRLRAMKAHYQCKSTHELISYLIDNALL